MNISKELKKLYKKEKFDKNRPYGIFVRKKEIIKSYYEENKNQLLMNERLLVKRYNELYLKSDGNPTSKNIISFSIISGIVVTAIFDFSFGSTSEPGIIIAALNSCMEIYNVSVAEIEPFSVKLLCCFILVFSFCIILLIDAFFIDVFERYLIWTSRSKKLFQKLVEYEMEVIECVLNQKYDADDNNFIKNEECTFQNVFTNDSQYIQGYKDSMCFTSLILLFTTMFMKKK